MSQMKLMLVDDEERFLATTQKLLAKKGYQVLTAPGGQEALDMLNRQEVHVVVLDVKMPGMDGVSVLRQIKQFHPLVEVIMLTGHATVDTAVEGLKLGAFDYLAKPIDIDELVAKAEEAFHRRERAEQKIQMAQARTYVRSPREILKPKTDDPSERRHD